MSPLVSDEVQILYDEDDITDYVMFKTAVFTSNMAASPGTWEFTCRDPNQELNEFLTGHRITVKLNGVIVYGGILWEVGQGYAFPADDTSDPEAVTGRLWFLSGTDHNIIFDRGRILRNPAHYNKAIFSPGTSSGSVQVIAPITDGEVIRNHLRFYVNMSGYETQDPDFIKDNWTFVKGYAWPEQGSKFRAVMDDLAGVQNRPNVGAVSVYWFRGTQLNFTPIQELAQDWGFSDVPDGTEYFGFREGRGATNGMSIINDMHVWGGSQWAKHGDVVHARVEDIASQLLHNRWEGAAVEVGNAGFMTQASVDTMAELMVFGHPTGVNENSMGRTNPERTFRCTWFHTRVPDILEAGQVVPVRLSVFGEDPVNLALRSLKMSWPGLANNQVVTHRGWTMFEGQFGMLMSDPAWMWKYLQVLNPGKIIRQVQPTAKNDTSRPPYLSIYIDRPATQAVVGESIVVTLDNPNGSKTLFHIPFRYIGNTSQVFVDGLAQYRGLDYVETSPVLGTYTIFEAPDSGAIIQIRTLVAGTLET